jgi:hypothetical protein
MEPAVVVDILDEVGKVFSDIVEGFENDRVNSFDLQRLHEALGLGVVVGIASAAHRADQTLINKKLPVDLGGILGGFNRSSQHQEIGGCNDGSPTRFGSVHSKEARFARTSACLAA